MKDAITVALATLTFIVCGLLVYWRENKKLFQERIFEHKFTAYREIIEEIGMYYEDVFQFLEFFQGYEKTREEWLVDSKPYFAEYYPKAFALMRLYYKNLVLLPQSQVEELNELLGRCIRHVTVHHHFGTEIPHESHDELYDLLISFAENARQDLSVNILNATLNRRLVEALYPVRLPKKSVKDVDGAEEGEGQMD